MKGRKFVSILSVLFFIFSTLFCGFKVNAAEDFTPPLFKSLSVSKKNATGGDTVKVIMDAEDLESGLADWAYIAYVNPTGAGIYAYPDLINGKYEYTFNISPYEASGAWQVDYIEIYDNNDNITYVYNSELYENDIYHPTADLSGGNFTVFGTTADYEAPELRAVTVNKKAATGGDIVKVSLNVTDAVSGVEEVSLQYRSPTGGSYYYNAKLENGSYVANVLVGQYAAAGDWKIETVYVYDKVYNERSYGNSNLTPVPYSEVKMDLSGGDFTVSGTINDKIDPVLSAISINKTAASLGETLTLTLNAADGESGIKTEELDGLFVYNFSSMPNVEFVSPSGFKRNAILRTVNGKYQVVFNVGMYTEPGTWKISKVMLYDKAGNNTAIGNSSYSGNTGIDASMDLSAANFTVTGTVKDIEIPVINGVSVNKSVVNAKDYIKLTVEAQDSISGLKQGSRDYEFRSFDGSRSANTSADYLSPSGKLVNVDLKLLNNKYYADILAEEYNSNGVWKLAAVTAMDTAGNMTTVGNSALTQEEWQKVNVSLGKGSYDSKIDLSGGNFTLQNSFTDTTVPKLKSVSLSSSSITGAGKVQLTLDIEETGSGLGEISTDNPNYGLVMYSTPAGYRYWCDIKFVNNKYVIDFESSPFQESGVWKIERVALTDRAGNGVDIGNTSNSFSYDYDIGMDLSAGDITVAGTTFDDTPPAVNGVNVSSETTAQAAVVTVTVDVSDAISGINEYEMWGNVKNYLNSIEYISNSGKKKYIPLQLINGKYTANVSFGRYEETGVWKINWIQFTDKAGNYTSVFNSKVIEDDDYYDNFMDLSAGNITVTGTTVDFKAPEFTSITVDKKTMRQTDTLNITVKAADDLSGINDALLSYISPSGSVRYCGLLMVNGELKGSLTINDELKSDLGLWQPYQIELYDKVDNRTIIGNYKYSLLPLDSVDSVKDMSAGDFTLALAPSPEDLNGDSLINILDLAFAARLYNTKAGQPGWSSQCDLNSDNIIDIFDLVRVSKMMK